MGHGDPFSYLIYSCAHLFQIAIDIMWSRIDIGRNIFCCNMHFLAVLEVLFSRRSDNLWVETV